MFAPSPELSISNIDIKLIRRGLLFLLESLIDVWFRFHLLLDWLIAWFDSARDWLEEWLEDLRWSYHLRLLRFWQMLNDVVAFFSSSTDVVYDVQSPASHLVSSRNHLKHIWMFSNTVCFDPSSLHLCIIAFLFLTWISEALQQSSSRYVMLLS